MNDLLGSGNQVPKSVHWRIAHLCKRMSCFYSIPLTLSLACGIQADGRSNAGQFQDVDLETGMSPRYDSAQPSDKTMDEFFQEVSVIKVGQQVIYTKYCSYAQRDLHHPSKPECGVTVQQ